MNAMDVPWRLDNAFGEGTLGIRIFYTGVESSSGGTRP